MRIHHRGVANTDEDGAAVSESTKPCARCNIAERMAGKSYCRLCVGLFNQETSVRRKARLEKDPGYRDPANSKPCARCHKAPRQGTRSYCRLCVSLINKEQLANRKKRNLEIDPHRYDPASSKPCARCGTAPREVTSYCRPCHRELGRESYKRIGGKKFQELCSRCGKERDGRHPSYCKVCWQIKCQERKTTPCIKCGEPRGDESKGQSVYCYKCQRGYWVKLKYGLTSEEYELMLEKQEYRCAVCRCTENGRTWHIDHCHNTQLVRGILCDNCNRGLGHLKDDLEIVRRLVTYLEKFERISCATNAENASNPY